MKDQLGLIYYGANYVRFDIINNFLGHQDSRNFSQKIQKIISQYAQGLLKILIVFGMHHKLIFECNNEAKKVYLLSFMTKINVFIY